MTLGVFLLEVLQRPRIDPELLKTYEKLMRLLENDSTLEHMCQDLPEWLMHRLTQDLENS